MRVEFGQRKWEIKPEKPAGGSYKLDLQLKGGMAKCLEERGGHKMLTGQWLGGIYTEKGDLAPAEEVLVTKGHTARILARAWMP